jgi:hypothetical protein
MSKRFRLKKVWLYNRIMLVLHLCLDVLFNPRRFSEFYFLLIRFRQYREERKS